MINALFNRKSNLNVENELKLKEDELLKYKQQVTKVMIHTNALCTYFPLLKIAPVHLTSPYKHVTHVLHSVAIHGISL